ncbi:MAG: hypothetical protein Q8Q14_04890 [Gemmatimonadales bacterium]|nr:hypothetical protein [Gemmatimonadales bacterium]
MSYHATYRLLRSHDVLRDLTRENWDGAVSFAFDRNRRAAVGSVEYETLDISPEFIPTGSYLLRLEIYDLAGRRRVGRATLAFEVEGAGR